MAERAPLLDVVDKIDDALEMLRIVELAAEGLRDENSSPISRCCGYVESLMREARAGVEAYRDANTAGASS